MQWLWTVAVVAIIAGPFLIALAYGLRHRRSGAPTDDGALEAQAMTRIMKDINDMRTWGGSRR